MMKNIKTLLETEIQDEIGALRDMEAGTENYKSTVDGLTKLTDRLIEMEKVDIDREEKAKSREIENELKFQEMENEQKDRLVKNCLTGASIVTGIGLTVWGTLKSLKFEETGTVTTIVGRGFINKLFSKK